MNSFMQKKETVTRNWYVIDAEGKPLGRVASKAAVLLRGKHKPTYTPHIDCGDYVIIVNASKVLLTGNKLEDKKYYNHSQYLQNTNRSHCCWSCEIEEYHYINVTFADIVWLRS